MSDILVRDLDRRLVTRLKATAKRHKRSLQAEVKAILLDAVSFLPHEAWAISGRWQKHFSGRKFSDSTDLIREDRDR